VSNRSPQTLVANDRDNPEIRISQTEFWIIGRFVARPELPAKTALAERLREFRRRIGASDRFEFAAALGVGKSTLASYERGDSEPVASVLAVYREHFGADLDWLLFGTGVPPLPADARMAVSANIFRRLGEAVGRAHAAAGIKLPMGAEFEEAANLYNEFLGLVPNPFEAPTDIVEATLGIIEARLAARLSQAHDNPGSGNRST
jgi:transcriptional regulator with XRE-family HTH domain